MKANPIPSAYPVAASKLSTATSGRGLLVLVLGAMATLAVPAARAAVTFPMYVSSGSNTIVQISPTGVVSPFATLPAPYGLAFDAGGNLYAADGFTNQISKITDLGAVSLFATLPANSVPFGLAFDGSGNLYAADDDTNQISQISPDGLTVSPFATGISVPHFIAFAPVPEPSSAVLLAAAAGSLLLRRRRSRV